MRTHGTTTSTSDDGFRRVEVITGLGRRRRWTDEEKAWIVAESLDPATPRSRRWPGPVALCALYHSLGRSVSVGRPFFCPMERLCACRLSTGRLSASRLLSMPEHRDSQMTPVV